MKHFTRITLASLAVLGTLATVGCSPLSGGKGTLTVWLDVPGMKGTPLSIPDTDDFILTVTDSKGGTIYDGRFGDSPDEFELKAGSYTVSASSIRFDSPAFGSPCFSDSRVVIVGRGDAVVADLLCVQSNCGIRVIADGSFKEAFPDATIRFSSRDEYLECGYDMDDYAYFSPGSITVSLHALGEGQDLFSRTLEAQQMLSVRLSAGSGDSASPSDGISIHVDSSRNYLSDSYRYGDSYAGDIDNAFTVQQARDHAGSKDVWVKGYIVGVATGTGKIRFEGPYDRETNIVLGGKSATSDPDHCLSVELKSGSIRDELNLCTNPELEGRQIYIKGDLVSAYYGIPGLKNVSEYQFSGKQTP